MHLIFHHISKLEGEAEVDVVDLVGVRERVRVTGGSCRLPRPQLVVSESVSQSCPSPPALPTPGWGSSHPPREM